MRVRIFGLIILLVFCFGIVSAYAQEPKEQLYYVVYSIVEPSMADKYEATAKKLIAEYRKHNLKYSISAFSTTEFDYYHLIPINNFTDLDNGIKYLSPSSINSTVSSRCFAQARIASLLINMFNGWVFTCN